MIPRQLEATVNRLAKGLPVITITGPRQSGKTTLAREMFSDHEYVSLENPDNQQLATVDPHAFLNLHSGPTIFDEAQRIPTLFSYLQETVDRTNTPGQYVLTGSQNFLLLKSISQTLAGRVGVTYLLPLSYRELLNANLRPGSIEDFIVKGGYPRLYSSELIASDFYASYLRTYVERDVRDELGVRKIADFRKYLTLCATRIGNIFSDSTLASESKISANTASDWLSILESSFITFRLQPYYKNYGKRLVKTPKIYFHDTGLASHLLHVKSGEQLLRNGELRGRFFENLVVSEIVKQHYARGDEPQLYYWRDSNGKEIDLIIEQADRIRYAVEIKASRTRDVHAFDTMCSLAQDMGLEPEQRIVVYGGDEAVQTKLGRFIGLQHVNELVD